ncbi:MAG: BON domain-containing protein [Gammaproteobacteria bacterium]|jgi:osmotically-inducible protein OsmY
MKTTCLGVWLLCCTLPVAAAETPNEACTDPCLKAAITVLFIRSPFLSPFRLGIAVKDSVVTLDGTVSEPSQSQLAEEIATGIDGVTAVINRIRVEPPASSQQAMAPPRVDCVTGDAGLADRVRMQLHWNRSTHGMAIAVTASDGIVTLDGPAADAQQAELARLIAINTCGVKRVKSHFQIPPD